MKINFKLAERSDTSEVMEMMSEFYRHEELEFNKDKIEKILESLLTDINLGRIWLIENGKEKIGYLVLTYGFSIEYGGRDALIDEFFIKENYRGKGIGTEALRIVEESCRALGINAINLQVKKFNPNAKRLYERGGFKVIERDFLIKKLI